MFRDRDRDRDRVRVRGHGHNHVHGPNRTNISRRFKNCFLNPNTAAIDTY